MDGNDNQVFLNTTQTIKVEINTTRPKQAGFEHGADQGSGKVGRCSKTGGTKKWKIP